jgi:hypothetical protein
MSLDANRGDMSHASAAEEGGIDGAIAEEILNQAEVPESTVALSEDSVIAEVQRRIRAAGAIEHIRDQAPAIIARMVSEGKISPADAPKYERYIAGLGKNGEGEETE